MHTGPAQLKYEYEVIQRNAFGAAAEEFTAVVERVEWVSGSGNVD